LADNGPLSLVRGGEERLQNVFGVVPTRAHLILLHQLFVYYHVVPQN